MGRQFKRVVKLLVRTVALEYTLDEFDIEFTILLRRDSKPNVATITIWNLSEDTRNAFKDEEEYSQVEFSAGYIDTEPPLIFKGAVTNVVNTEVGDADQKTVLHCGDGQVEFEKTYFSKTYSAGVVLDTIISEIAGALKVDITSMVPELLFIKTKKAVVLEGKAKKALDKLAADYDLGWSIQLGALEITKKGEPPVLDPLVTVLGPNSGLIGSPRLAWTKKKKNKKSKPKLISVVTARANLNGEVKPNRLVEIKAEDTIVTYGQINVETLPSTDANGVYIADKVKFFGDNSDGPFDIEVTADGR